MVPENKRINSKSALNDWVSYELANYNIRGVVDLVQRLFCLNEPGVLAKHLLLLRRAEYHINTGHKIRSAISRVRLARFQNRYCLHVPPNTCGRGLRIMHVGPVLINGRATVGEDCVLHICSAIVAKGNSDDVPTLGDGVIVGYGACVVGGVRVADGVAVGAGSVVCKDVLDDGVTVAGAPAKAVGTGGAASWHNRPGLGDRRRDSTK